MKVFSFRVVMAALAVMITTFQACKDSGEDCPGSGRNYRNGFFVVNEGSFNGVGTVSWFNPDTGDELQDVFPRENCEALLGQFVQSLTRHNNSIYVVVGGANEIVVVDDITFRQKAVIQGLVLPRYFLPIDDRFAYVSQWGNGGLDGSVAKVDLSTNTVVKTIPTGNGPEKMVRVNDLVWVANSGGFGVDSTISILNPATDTEVERRVMPGKNPASFYSNSLGEPWVLGRGNYLNSAELGWLKAGNLYTLTDLPQGADDLAGTGSTAYFFGGGNIYRATPAGVEVFKVQPAYGLNVNPVNGHIYAADALDFNSNGKLLRFSPDGNLLQTWTTGIAPGEIIF